MAPDLDSVRPVQLERHDHRLTCTVTVDQVWQNFAFSGLIIDQIQADDQHLIVDLGFVDLLHSPGLANLVNLLSHCTKNGLTFALKNVNAANLKLLRATRLDQLLTVVD